nr:hypothetical protein [Tanacetum cinerariifolium]
MSSTFVDTHNMVAILTKSDASEGFDQILDFLNGSYIRYALTMNPHIYVSCIKQFWNTVTVKQSTDVTRLQALVDRKKVVISEAVIRDILRLDDAKRVDCLPNEEIFTGLARMGSAMASAVICLSTGRKFNFSKYIFDSLVRNVDNSSKFYMYPRVGKGFSGVETPLFEGMLVVRENVVAEDVQEPSIPSPPQDLPSTSQMHHTPPSSLQPQPQAQPQAADFSLGLLQTALDTCAALTNKIEQLETDKLRQAFEITKLKKRVKRLKKGHKVKVFKLRRLKKVGTSQRVKTFNDISYSDSDYAGASLDRKFTTGGCQFLGCRLISWQCKKHTVVATSSTEAEYVAAASGCAQVLWIQNQLLDYGFTWVFFLATKDETTPILKTFITGLENQLSLKVKMIRSDNGTEFKNSDLNQKNKTLIEAARTMLADSLLPIPFWAEAVNTASYVQNRVLVTKPHNKTPYELLHGRTPSISFMRPFGCPVTIRNTLDHLGKFQRKINEGFLVGYSVCSKAFRVFNSRTRIVQETLHVNFLENKPNVAGTGPTWLFDIDSLSRTMNYHPVSVENQPIFSAGFQDTFDAEKAGEEVTQTYVLFLKPVSADIHSSSSSAQTKKQADKTERENKGKSHVESFIGYRDLNAEFTGCSNNSSNGVNAATVSPTYEKYSFIAASTSSHDPDMPALKELTFSDDEAAVGVKADINNLESFIPTRSMARAVKDQGFEDLNHPDKVYKVVKALYGLHQAPRAWYETLATYLLENGFQRGIIDQTLFIKKHKGDILLVQIYVDDIIFGATNKALCKSFEKLMKDRKLASTPIDAEKPLLKDPDGEDVDVHTYSASSKQLLLLHPQRLNM